MRIAYNRLGFSHLPTTGSYRAIHTWMNSHFPRTGRCEWCACTGRWTEYAAARPGHYTRNRADWVELCRTCHRYFDYASTKKGARIRGDARRGRRDAPAVRAAKAARPRDLAGRFA